MILNLSLHAHVHANTLTMRHGIVFASSAAASEYPMQWREVHVLPCEIRLRTRPLHLPLLLDKSARRESRGGQGGADVNAAKAGRGVADVDLVFRGGPKCPKTAGES